MHKSISKIVPIFLLFVLPFKTYCQCNNSPHIYNLVSNTANYKFANLIWRFEPKLKYIGVNKDSIYIGVESNIKESLKAHIITRSLEKQYPNLLKLNKSPKISIEVCTRNLIKLTSPDNFSGEDKMRNIEINYYFPVIIRNIDSIPIYLSSQGVWPYQIESQDNNGNWKVFKNDFYFICGEPMAPSYFLKPNEIAIVVIPLYEENNNRKIRIKRFEVYSNEFVQHINQD